MRIIENVTRLRLLPMSVMGQALYSLYFELTKQMKACHQQIQLLNFIVA